MEERMIAAKTSLSRLHAGQLSFNQKRVLVSIARFMPDSKKTNEQNNNQIMLLGELKAFVRKFKSNDNEVK